MKECEKKESRINLALTESLYKKVKQFSRIKGKTVNSTVADILSEYFRTFEKKAGRSLDSIERDINLLSRSDILDDIEITGLKYEQKSNSEH